MALQLIGAGLGRTGTLSLKFALEQIGFAPCYHMVEVIPNPGFIDYWVQAAEGAVPDWDEVFAGYAATVDWPACSYWRELADRYPHAKVLLTTRDAERWYASTQATIFSQANIARMVGRSPKFRRMIAAIEAQMGGSLQDRDGVIAAFHRHNAAVMAGIPAERLLVYSVTEGWEPLCRFLGVPVPDGPFPQTNSTDEFRAMLEGGMASGRH